MKRLLVGLTLGLVALGTMAPSVAQAQTHRSPRQINSQIARERAKIAQQQRAWHSLQRRPHKPNGLIDDYARERARVRREQLRVQALQRAQHHAYLTSRSHHSNHSSSHDRDDWKRGDKGNRDWNKRDWKKHDDRRHH